MLTLVLIRVLSLSWPRLSSPIRVFKTWMASTRPAWRVGSCADWY